MVRLLAEASEGPKAGEKVLDAADILNTLCGSSRIAAILEHGAAQGKGRLTGLPRAEFSTIGYASDPLPTWPIAGIRRKTDPVWRALRIPELAKAASADCLVDMEPENAGQNLILAIGPQDEIDAEGFMATRDWLGKYSTIGEVRAGDYPVKSKMLEVIVVFSGLTKIHRVTEILDAGK
jgi:hypothetical protein